MNRKVLFSVFLLLLAVSAAVASYTRASQNRTAASLTGVWKGNLREAPAVPAVELSLNIQAGRLGGKVVFYKVADSGAGAEIKGKVEEPLIDPVFDGQVLSFKVKREDGSFFKGKVKFVAEHEAVLLYDDQDTGDELSMILRREK